MPSDQPFLHRDVVIIRAPLQVWSGPDGQIGRPDVGPDRLEGVSSAQGVYRGDLRLIDRARLSVDGLEPEAVGFALPSADHGIFRSVIRTPSAPTPDPQLVLERERRLTEAELTETITLRSALTTDFRVEITMKLSGGLAEMSQIRSGRPGASVPADPRLDGPQWVSGGTSAQLRPDRAHVAFEGSEVRLSWSVIVPAGGEISLGWGLRTRDLDATLSAPGSGSSGDWASGPIARPISDRINALAVGDVRWRRWLSRSAGDLDALTMAPVDQPDRAFLAAGAPWYFTLFGRDSLWAARMVLPVCPELALTTLQVLAGRQGVRDDPESAEQPGKILHELRDRPVRLSGTHRAADPVGLSLPPVYYGSTDATCLWISLLAQVRRAGADPADVRALLPALEAALGWLSSSADADGDGFVEYLDGTGHGLSNQGWKDSEDAIRFADGSRGEGSIALVEVQGYAYRAALDGAELLEAFDRTGAEQWRLWASELALRFREAFWCHDALGAYPALALDDPSGRATDPAAKRRVDGVSSNIGHLLGTGILNPEESALVAARLRHPSMFSGFGIRTLSAANGGYWPWSYHCGSVWAHDTAVIIDGLRRDGHVGQAAELATGLLAAAESFDHRLPELFAGDGAFPLVPPSPYPAACRPQAWAAAAVVPAAQALGIL